MWNLLSGRTRRGASLVEILIVVLVLILIAAFVIPRYLGGQQGGAKAAANAKNEALDAACLATLNQVRESVSMVRTMHPTDKPQSLADFHLPDSETHCIVGGETYIYSPETGQVHCPHPGHESY